MSSLGPGALVALGGSVAFGSVVPVIPTGAAVAAAAAIARAVPAEIALVVAVGALGAYVGDLITYAVLHRAGVPLAVRLGWLDASDPHSMLRRLRARLEAHEVRALVLARLLPAGRIPVLLVAALGGYPFRRFASAAVASTLAWSTMYAAIGVVGKAVIPNPTVAVIAVAALALLVPLATQGWQGWRRRGDGEGPAPHQGE